MLLLLGEQEDEPAGPPLACCPFTQFGERRPQVREGILNSKWMSAWSRSRVRGAVKDKYTSKSCFCSDHPKAFLANWKSNQNERNKVSTSSGQKKTLSWVSLKTIQVLFLKRKKKTRSRKATRKEDD